MQARLALLNNEPDKAVTYGNKAIELNRRVNDNLELANSYRLSGKAMGLLNGFNNALKYYERAFELDKSLEASHKMLKDLMDLGYLTFNNSGFEDAITYFRRAILIAEGAGNEKVVKEAVGMVEKALSKIE